MFQGVSKNGSKSKLISAILVALGTLVAGSYTNEIKGSVNFQLMVINSEIEASLPTIWLIVSILLVIIFSAIALDVAFRLKDWFKPQPQKAEWVSSIIGFIIVLAVAGVYVHNILQLTVYFFSNLP